MAQEVRCQKVTIAQASLSKNARRKKLNYTGIIIMITNYLIAFLIFLSAPEFNFFLVLAFQFNHLSDTKQSPIFSSPRLADAPEQSCYVVDI